MRCALLSEGLDFAKKSMGRIQRRLEIDGPATALQEHFGPFVPATSDRSKKWNSEELTLLASDHDEQDPSIACVGITGNIRGARWDRVYLDDVQSLRTKNKTASLLEVFRGDVITRPGRMGKIIITGSRVGRGDFYEELERLDLIDELVCIPALDLSRPVGEQSYFPRQHRSDGQPVLDEKGNQMGWSDEDLAQRRMKVGEDQWSRVYMMRPQSDHSAMISEGDIANATDHDRLVGQQPATSIANMAGLDPSLANHAAFTYCAYNADTLYVVDLFDFNKPTTNQALFAKLEEGTRRYRPDWWVIENNTLQRGYLTDDAFLRIKQTFGFQSAGHHTGENKLDAQLGVPAMMNAIVRGEIRFPSITPNDTAFATLFDQLQSWRPDIATRRLVQDQVMSLWFCYLLWKKLRQQVGQSINMWKRLGLDSVTKYPYARTNLTGLEETQAQKMPLTYDQHWQSLTVEAS